MKIDIKFHLPMAALLAFVGVSAACSFHQPLSSGLAADLISKSETFKSVPQFWLRTGTIANRDYTSPEYLVLQHHGWITGANVPCPPDVSPPPCWDVALTPLGVDTFRNFISKNTVTSSYFNVPTAKRELVEVVGLSQEGYMADVDFRWKWDPMNELGSALYPAGIQYQSTVGFRRYEDGWRLFEGSSAKPQQRLEDALKNAEVAR